LAMAPWLGSATAQTAASNSSAARVATIGILANSGSNQCLAKWNATAEYLTEHVPGFRFAIVPLGYADVESAVKKQQVDFVFVNPAMYVTLEAQYQISRIATLKNRQGDAVAATYGTVIFCRSNSRSIRSLGDLKGKSFMAPEENSFGGWLMALRELHQKGIDPDRDFKSLQFSGTQDGVVFAVIHGDVDAGAVRTDMLERMAGEGKISLGDFRVITAYDGPRDAGFPYLVSTRTYPEWALAKLQNTPLALAEQVAEQLRKMPPGAEAAKKAGIAGWTYPDDYDDVRECLEELGVGPSRPSIKLTLATVVKTYWAWLLAGMLTIAAMAGAIAMFARLNLRLAFAEKKTRDELSHRRGAEKRLAAAAEAIRDRNEWLNTVVNTSADGIIAIDEQGKLTLFNPAAGCIFGWKPEEMIGQSLDRLIPHELRQGHYQKVRNYFATNMPKMVERQIIGLRRNGEHFPMEMSIAIGGPSDKHFAVAILRDITLRKRHEEELRLAKELAEDAAARLPALFRAVEQNPASVAITDSQGSIEYVNPGFVSATGYTLEEVIGKNPRILKSNVHPPEFYRQMWQVLLEGEVWRDEICNRKKNGELYWEDATIAPVVDADGHITHFVAMKLDITTRKQAEAELKQAVDQLQRTTALQQAILNSTEYSIIATKQDGTITTFNAGAEHLLGYRAEEVVGKVTPEIIHDKEELIKRAQILSKELAYPVPVGFETFIANAQRGCPDENEWTYIRKDGTRFPVLLSVTAICDDTGQVTGFMGIAQDITKRKQAEETLKLAKEQAEEASRAKSQFLATMSHELRTPLNGVIGMTELLRDTQLDRRQREFVDACHSSGESLLGLINDVLDFSKIEAGKLELEVHEFNLSSLLKETLDMMTFQALQKGLQLSTHITPQTCHWVRGDSGRLRQVLVNLIGNAIKFTEAGKVAVKVELDKIQSGKATIRFEVSDTGIGIPPDRIDRLFKSFSQADSSTTRKYGGTGLGLAICKRLVELMDGRIGVESQEGRGSIFWFEVPLQPLRDDYMQELEQMESADVRRQTHATLLKGRRVLLAEDNRVNRMFAQEVIQRAGIECYTAANGLQAIQAIKKRGRFDLVLMDCQMPEMDGYEATRRIREMERNGELAGHLPVIALTASSIKGEREQCLAAGMDAYLSKPFTPNKLLDVIGQLLAAKEGEPAAGQDPESQATPSQAAGQPPIDRDALLARCMGNLEFAQSLLSDFESDLPKCVDQITQNIQNGDIKAAIESAHSLKGAAGTITADPLRMLAAEIESAGKSGNLAEVAPLADQLREEAQRCMKAIPKLRELMAHLS